MSGRAPGVIYSAWCTRTGVLEKAVLGGLERQGCRTSHQSLLCTWNLHELRRRSKLPARDLSDTMTHFSHTVSQNR